MLLGTLAAAFAEQGQFDQAAAMAERAITLARTQGATEIANRNLDLLELYRKRQPFHEEPQH